MKCPNCRDKDLAPVITKQGVEVDFCPQCEGIWLDKNEIYLFTSAPAYLKIKIEEAIQCKRSSAKLSPVFSRPMAELPILDGQVNIDYCPESEGIWLDKDEINNLPAVKTKIQIDKGIFENKETGLPILPDLGLRSAVTLFGLYALLSLFLIVSVELGKISPAFALGIGLAAVVVQFTLSPFIMDLFLRTFYRMNWAQPEDLPEHLKSFISNVCRDKGIKYPRIGIIADGSPNAFTYGHHPNNARIIFTRGLIDLLSDKELEAVSAHEIGHVLHWDMLVMTLAQLVPLVLNFIYRTLARVKSSGKDKTAPLRICVAACAYVLYLISEFIVLWFSRLREYFADRFSGEITADPNALSSALVKIGYGLAGDDNSKGALTYKERQDTLNSIGPMGIFDSRTAGILAVSGYRGPRNMGGEVDKEKIKDAARWDLWNPWAAYYELQSTHPLIAKRLKFLSSQSRAIGKQPYIEFNQRKPESYWDDFFLDLAVKLLPATVFVSVLILFALTRDAFFLWTGMFVFGSAYLIHNIFSYPNTDFPVMNIKNLLSKVKVSAVRPVPCSIKGKIIGRGVPGLIFSEDFVMQDETGIIFLDYRQPLQIFNFLFGLLRAGGYVNEDVEITGWYRRSPMPYIEIRKLKIADRQSFCLAYDAKIVFSLALILLGLAKALSLLH